jgi:hypothetical protein
MKHSDHLLHVGCRTAPSRRVSAGCAPSGLALHLREHQGCRRCAQAFGDEDPGVQDRLRHEGARRGSICSWMSGDIGVDAVDPAEHARGQELVMVGGEMPVERSAQLVLVLLYLHRRRLKVRIHGRPRSDRKKRFLLSAVAPSTSTRHPRKARPINWARRGGLASGREMSADAEATFHRASCTLGNQVVAASDGPPFRQECRPTRVCRTLGAGSDLLAEGTRRAG